MAWTLYDKFRRNAFDQANGAIDLDTNTIKIALVTSLYTADQALDEFWSTPQANEVSGTNYTAGARRWRARP